MKSMYWLVVVVLAVLYVKYYHVIGPRLLLMLVGLYAVLLPEGMVAVGKHCRCYPFPLLRYHSPSSLFCTSIQAFILSCTSLAFA